MESRSSVSNDLNDIPSLLPLCGSEDASSLLGFESSGCDHCGEEDECNDECSGGCCGEDPQESPLEWTIQMLFSRGFSESELKQAFRPLITGQTSKPILSFKVYFIGLLKRADSFEEVPLFVGALDEKPKRQLKSSKKKVARPPVRFYHICCYARLITSSNDVYENEDEEDDDDDINKTFEPELLEEKDLKSLKEEVSKRAKQLDKGVNIEVPMSESDGAKRASDLTEMILYCDRTISLSLLSEQGFKGVELWDVMLCLGFEYDSEMKSFILTDDDRLLITVTCNQPTKYFYPMDMASGHPINEINFNCFIPHCSQPLETIRAMAKAAQYAQKRLGGRLLDDKYEDMDVKRLEDEVNDVTTRMKEMGVQPGSIFSMDLF